MELNDELNNQYKRDKEEYKKVLKLKQIIGKYEKNLHEVIKNKRYAELDKDMAIEAGNKVAEKEANTKIKKYSKEEEDIKRKIEKTTKILETSKKKIDSYIDELSKDPKLKSHIYSSMKKTYDRKMKKEMEKVTKIETLINICENHPTIENSLKGIIKARDKELEIDARLAKLDPIKDKAEVDKIMNIEIPTIDSKKKVNRKIFFDFCQKNNIDIDEKFIDEVILSDKVNDKEPGRVNRFAYTKDGVIKTIKTLKNLQNRTEKRVYAYQKSLEKVHGVLNEMPVKKQEQKDSSEQTKNQIDTDKDQIDTDKDEIDEEKLPANKYKWYEIRKRFADWRARRKTAKQAKNEIEEKEESEEKDKETKETKETVSYDESEKFRNAYKYDIIKDYVEKQQKDIYEESLKEAYSKPKQRQEDENER